MLKKTKHSLVASSFKISQVGRFAESLVPLINGDVDVVSRALSIRKNQKKSLVNSMSHLKKYGLRITIKKVKGTKYSHRVIARMLPQVSLEAPHSLECEL